MHKYKRAKIYVSVSMEVVGGGGGNIIVIVIHDNNNNNNKLNEYKHVAHIKF